MHKKERSKIRRSFFDWKPSTLLVCYNLIKPFRKGDTKYGLEAKINIAQILDGNRGINHGHRHICDIARQGKPRFYNGHRDGIGIRGRVYRWRGVRRWGEQIMDATTIISLCFSGVMMIVGVVTFILTNVRQTKKDTATNERQFMGIREDLLTVKLKIEEMSTSVNEMRAAVKEISTSVGEIDRRLIITENSLKTAFIRIDELRASIADKKEN